MEFLEWCYKAHEDTNHKYAGYLPYRYHLEMAIQVAKDFPQCVPQGMFFVTLYACAGHDLFEDARKSYNDVMEALKCTSLVANHRLAVVEIILAVTEYPGRNRKERHPPIYWQHIRETPGAKLVKLCDKIGNVRHSARFEDSKMRMHKDEHDDFMKEMELELIYQPMIDHLVELLTKA